MKITRTYCDKCKNETNETIYNVFRFLVYGPFFFADHEYIDFYLCNKCRPKLNKWLKTR